LQGRFDLVKQQADLERRELKLQNDALLRAALDQAGQKFGTIMLTRKPHASGVAAWPVDWPQR
jgi:hypothetical protein